MKKEESRIHPDLSVPEGVPVITKPAQAHGGEAVGGTLAGEGIKMVEHEPDVPLTLIIAVNDDVAFPEVCPCGLMVFDQLAASLKKGKDGETFGFVEGVVVVGRGKGGADDGKVVDHSGGELLLEFHQVHIVVPHLMDNSRLGAMRLVEDKT